MVAKLNVNADFVQVRRGFANVPVVSDRIALHALVSAQLGGAPLDYMEFGVWRGESLRLWTELNQNPDSRFFGFDTFDGLPEDWGKVPKGTFSTGGVPPLLADTRVQLISGLFQKTLYPFLGEYQRGNRAVVHIDCDLYSSTLFCLAAVDRLLRYGDILIFDDFYSLDHEFEAFLDYSRSFYRVLRPLAASPYCGQVAFTVVGETGTSG